MRTYIALFRGINIVGNNRLPMKDLKRLLEQNACADVRTYIQSGNAIFCTRVSDADRLAKRITNAVAASHGFAPRVLLLTREQLEKAAAQNPYPQADDNPTTLHLFFLEAAAPKADLKACAALATPTERFTLTGNVFYLYTPDGFGKSKLAAKAEKLLGVAATARNWRTVTTLLDMTAGQLPHV